MQPLYHQYGIYIQKGNEKTQDNETYRSKRWYSHVALPFLLWSFQGISQRSPLFSSSIAGMLPRTSSLSKSSNSNNWRFTRDSWTWKRQDWTTTGKKEKPRSHPADSSNSKKPGRRWNIKQSIWKMGPTWMGKKSSYKWKVTSWALEKLLEKWYQPKKSNKTKVLLPKVNAMS